MLGQQPKPSRQQEPNGKTPTVITPGHHCVLHGAGPVSQPTLHDRRLLTVRVIDRGSVLSKRYFQFWRGHCRRDTMVFTADRRSIRDAPSLRNHDCCRLEYAQMRPSASARAGARSALSSSAIAFRPRGRTRDAHAAAPPRCADALAAEPARRAGTGGRAPQSPPAARGGAGRPTSSRSAGRSPLPPVDAVQRERERRGHLVARPTGHAAHQGVEDCLVVCWRPLRPSARSVRDHLRKWASVPGRRYASRSGWGAVGITWTWAGTGPVTHVRTSGLRRSVHGGVPGCPADTIGP